LTLYEVDPLLDSRWLDFVKHHRAGSLFHTPQWLNALKRTYGFSPVALTDSAPGTGLKNALLFCRVSSWMTGRRLVSLPFSDHCEPLAESADTLASLLTSLVDCSEREGRYIELRAIEDLPRTTAFVPTAVYCLHTIDLRPELAQIFKSFHPSHTQRAIRKAERLRLTCEVGSSRALLAEFYALHGLTRRRHGTPIQPFAWFENLAEALGDRLRAYVARYEGQPVAAIMTAVHNHTLVYKYGCSNTSFNRFGGTPLLFWKAIQDAKSEGLHTFDLGRSDLSNPGLIQFKDHLGAARTSLTYYRHPATGRPVNWSSPSAGRTGRAFSLLPLRLQSSLSGHLYRHFA
jgi:CelD/BcsL family acetyltransferase involved in cellulose biosynthesis